MHKALGFILCALISLIFFSYFLIAFAKETSGSLPTLHSPKTWQEGTEPVLGQHDSLLTPVFPDAAWWNEFNDPALSQYELEGLKNSPTLDAQLARIQEAQGIVGQTRANQFPTLNVNPTYLRADLPDNIFSSSTTKSGSSQNNTGSGNGFRFPTTIKAFQLPFQAAYEVDLFGKYRNVTQSARKQYDATVQDASAARIALEADIAGAYFNLVRENALVASQTQNLQLLARVYQLKQNQNAMGLVTYDEVIRSDRDVAQAQTNLTVYVQQQAQAAHQLSILLGRNPQTAQQTAVSPIDTITLPTQVQAGDPSHLIARRPDILSAEAMLQKSKIDVKVARKAFLPTISLSALVGTAGGTFSNLFNRNSILDYETLGVKQPLFQGGALRATLNVRKAQQREQVDNYRQIILTALREVEDNIALLRADYFNLDANMRRLALTQKDLGLRQNLYQQGLSPHLDVLQSQSELAQYQQLAIQSKMDAAVATVNLYKALGGGF